MYKRDEICKARAHVKVNELQKVALIIHRASEEDNLKLSFFLYE